MRLGSTLLCRFVRSTSSHHRPWQISLAVTAGVLLGILPKTSLLVVLIGLICFVIPAHLPLLVLTAILISFATPLLESTLGRVGLWSLTHPQLSAYWMRLDSVPLVPWLGIHNTTVHGSLVAWFVVSLPVYLSTLVLSRTLIDSAIPDEVADIILSTDVRQQTIPVDQVQEIRPLSGLREAGSARPPIEPPFVIWDDINHDQNADEVARYERFYFDTDFDTEIAAGTEATSSDQVIRRAADTAAWAEELITDELLMDNRSRSDNHEMPQNLADNLSADKNADDEERWLIETTIEMVRIAERAVTTQAAMKAKQSGDAPGAASADSSTKESFEIQTGNANQDAIAKFQPISSYVGSQSAPAAATDDAVLRESRILYEQMPHYDHRSHLASEGVAGGAASGLVNRPREEALHYLLRHLKGVQEKAQK